MFESDRNECWPLGTAGRRLADVASAFAKGTAVALRVLPLDSPSDLWSEASGGWWGNAVGCVMLRERGDGNVSTNVINTKYETQGDQTMKLHRSCCVIIFFAPVPKNSSLAATTYQYIHKPFHNAP